MGRRGREGKLLALWWRAGAVGREPPRFALRAGLGRLQAGAAAAFLVPDQALRRLFEAQALDPLGLNAA